LPLAAPAQQSAKFPRLGVLLFSTPQADPQMETAQRGLRDLVHYRLRVDA